MLLARPIALLVSITITRRVSAVALCALAPAALLYPVDVWSLRHVEDAESIGFVLCLLATAIVPPVAAALGERGRATRALFALHLAAYVPLVLDGDLDRYFWRAVGRGDFEVAGGPLIRLTALVALGVMAFSRRKSRDLA